MKKTGRMILGVILAAGLLAGCGAASGSSQSAGTSASAAATVEASQSAESSGSTEEATSEETTSTETSETATSEETASTGTSEAAASEESTSTEAAETAASEETTSTETAETAAPEETASTEAAAAETAASTEPAAESGKILVVYFSATGNTKAVAETVADAVGADVFEITPAEPYTDEDLNYNDDSSRVSKEHEDESLQNQVALSETTVDQWDSYDTVFFGYPIWWGIAAWPVNQFVQNNDFTGKTVIPFCTSASSGLGQSAENLAEMAGTGDWQEGQRFASHPDEADVRNWAAGAIGR